MISVNSIPKDKPWLDFSSLTYLTTCPRKYYWRVVREVTSAETSFSLINGIAYHEAKATYYKCRMEGKSFEDSIVEAIKSMAPIMAEITQDDPKRNLTVATSTMLNYFKLWKDEPVKTIEVEITFAVDLINFLFVGRIDRYVEHYTFGRMIEETKTTSIVGSRWEMRVRPNLQMLGYASAVYLLTGEMPSGAILDVIPVTEKLNQRPFRHMTFYDKKDVEYWMANIQEWWATLQMYKSANIYPQNTEACAPLVGFTCDYINLCSKYPEPHKLDSIDLPGEFKIDGWKPYEDLEKVEGK